MTEALIDRDKIILQLHIKLGLIKQFVKALNKERDCFGVFNKFPDFFCMGTFIDRTHMKL